MMQPRNARIIVSVENQTLSLVDNDRIVASYPVSTSLQGEGTKDGSLKTPLGRFRIAEKFGDDQPEGMVFKSRVPTGEIHPSRPGEDLVQTRILWLDGCDPDNANTKSRYIYIHGTNHEKDIGKKASHGCIRMKNRDVAKLYSLTPVGTPVEIA